MSFLQRLKNRGVRSGQTSLQSESEETAVDKVAQLNVDVYQTENKIVIYAQAAGADMNDVNVSIEGDADIVLIEGRRIRPEYIVFPKSKEQGAYFASECIWGIFNEQLIWLEGERKERLEEKIKTAFRFWVLPLPKLQRKKKYVC